MDFEEAHSMIGKSTVAVLSVSIVDVGIMTTHDGKDATMLCVLFACGMTSRCIWILEQCMFNAFVFLNSRLHISQCLDVLRAPMFDLCGNDTLSNDTSETMDVELERLSVSDKEISDVAVLMKSIPDDGKDAVELVRFFVLGTGSLSVWTWKQCILNDLLFLKIRLHNEQQSPCVDLFV